MTKIVDTFIAPNCTQDVDVLYQDADLLLINKPSGLLSLSGKNPLNKDSVHFRLVQDFPTAALVHRLDFGTSGVMVVALNKQSNVHLAKQFQMRSVKKTYVALLSGHLAEEFGHIEQPIAKDPELFPKLKICVADGKLASTKFEVMERATAPRSTRVRFTPLTGRTHQLRLHSEFIGHPILGCDLYGTEHSLVAANRLMLHAETIEFEHPTSGKPLLGSCPAPF